MSNNMYQFMDSTLPQNNHLITQGNYPLDIINHAGLEAEYQDLLPEQGSRNLAAFKQVNALQSDGSPIVLDAGHGAEAAVDQDLSTYAGGTAGSVPWILQLGLDRTEEISSMAVYFQPGQVPDDYTIKSSINGTDWESIAHITDAHSGGNIIHFADKAVRTLRIEANSGSMGDQSGFGLFQSGAAAAYSGIQLAVECRCRFGAVDLASSNSLVVAIGSGGILEAVGVGQAEINVTDHSTNEVIDSIPVVVEDFAELLVKAEPQRIAVGRSAQAAYVRYFC